MTAPPSRQPLTRDRVLQAAIALADRDGLAALTMRSLAEALSVKPMAVYHHVAGKDEILDGIVDSVFGQIEQPIPGNPWRTEITRMAHSARTVLVQHSWVIALLESRPMPGPATLRHHDAVLGTFLGDGFSLASTAHAYALLDSFLYGYAVQEASLPFTAETSEATAEAMLAAIPPDAYPHFLVFARDYAMRPGYDFRDEFAIGLDATLDAIASMKPERITP
ncbi:MAG: TetR/AcrR family transcriptional regulator [Thermomicrobiales bacterium]